MLKLRCSFTFSVLLFTTLLFAFCFSAAPFEEGALKQNARKDLRIDRATGGDLPDGKNDWAEDEDEDDDDDHGGGDGGIEDTSDWAEDEDEDNEQAKSDSFEEQKDLAQYDDDDDDHNDKKDTVMELKDESSQAHKTQDSTGT